MQRDPQSIPGHPWTRRLLHPFVIMPLAAVLAVGVWWFAIRDTGDTETVTATTPTDQLVAVTKGSMSETVTADGTVAAAETDDLSFSSSGTVTAVNVAAGDTVTAGQVLATIDSAELQSDVTSAESKLADAQAKLADDQDADASDEQLAADIASIATATDALANAQEALAGASLVATFDGTVSLVDLTVGEELASGGTGGTTLTGSGTGSGQSSASLGSAGTGMGASQGTGTTTTAQIQVVSAGRYEVEVSVDSADIDSIAVGQTADVTVTTGSSTQRGFGGFGGGGFPTGAFPAGGFQGGGQAGGPAGNTTDEPPATSGRTTSGTAATGTVTEVSQVADASSGVATYAVTVVFSGDPDEFYVGTSVSAAIVTAERTDVLQVSSRAITTDDSGSSVLVSTDGTIDGETEQRAVEVGLTANGMTEITSGVAEGDQLLVTLPGRPGGATGAVVPTGAGR